MPHFYKGGNRGLEESSDCPTREAWPQVQESLLSSSGRTSLPKESSVAKDVCGRWQPGPCFLSLSAWYWAAGSPRQGTTPQCPKWDQGSFLLSKILLHLMDYSRYLNTYTIAIICDLLSYAIRFWQDSYHLSSSNPLFIPDDWSPGPLTVSQKWGEGSHPRGVV